MKGVQYTRLTMSLSTEIFRFSKQPCSWDTS